MGKKAKLRAEVAELRLSTSEHRLAALEAEAQAAALAGDLEAVRALLAGVRQDNRKLATRIADVRRWAATYGDALLPPDLEHDTFRYGYREALQRCTCIVNRKEAS